MTALKPTLLPAELLGIVDEKQQQEKAVTAMFGKRAAEELKNNCDCKACRLAYKTIDAEFEIINNQNKKKDGTKSFRKGKKEIAGKRSIQATEWTTQSSGSTVKRIEDYKRSDSEVSEGKH